MLFLEAIRAELVLGAVERNLSKGNPTEAIKNLEYLQKRVEYSESSLVDETQSGVMMAWEKPLMEAHAHVVCHGVKV